MKLFIEVTDCTEQKHLNPLNEKHFTSAQNMRNATKSQKHRRLQTSVTIDFRRWFAPDAQVIHLSASNEGDSEFDMCALEKAGVFITSHEELPDVLLFDSARNWLFLVEAITSHGPITQRRKEFLASNFNSCPAKCIFVSAFPDFNSFTQSMDKIAWETEVWLADMPSHMIHYNGDKFLGPH